MDRNGRRVEAVLGAGGFYSFRSSPTDDAIFAACRRGTTEIIEPLYVGMAQNPLQEDLFELNARCLRELGVASNDYTGEDFKRAFESGIFEPDLDSSDPGFSRCMVNPSAP